MPFGIVTCFLGKQTGKDGRVLAFEPQPEMVPQIRKVAATFQLENVEVFGIGLSDRTEKAILFRGEPGSTAIMESGRDWQTEEIEVDITTLDRFIEEKGIGRVDFIKCDVDGYEKQVLNGGKRVLERDFPGLLVEISEKAFSGVEDILRQSGYDGGVFWYKGKRYPAAETGNVPYRHVGAEFRNFLFQKRNKEQ